jgi:predicted MFS family arabinose efflux permease
MLKFQWQWSDRGVAWTMACGLALAVGGSLLGGWLVRWYGWRQTWLGSLVVMAALLLVLCVRLPQGLWGSVAVIAVLAFVRITKGVIDLAMTDAIFRASPEWGPHGHTVVSYMVIGLGGILGAFAVGHLIKALAGTTMCVGPFLMESYQICFASMLLSLLAAIVVLGVSKDASDQAHEHGADQ